MISADRLIFGKLAANISGILVEITLQTMVLLSNIIETVPLFRIRCMNRTPLYKGLSTHEKYVENHSIASLRCFSPKYSLSGNCALNVEKHNWSISVTCARRPETRTNLLRVVSFVVNFYLSCFYQMHMRLCTKCE